MGCTLNVKWDHLIEIQTRIEKARSVFIKTRKILCDMRPSISIENKNVRWYVFSTCTVLRHGVSQKKENWKLLKTGAVEEYQKYDGLI